MPISVRRRVVGTCLLVLGAVLLSLTRVAPSDAAAQVTGEIGNQIWFDDNDNGRVDAEEAGVPGVIVELFADVNRDGSPDGPVVQTATTSADGTFLFVGLSPGPYAVRLPVENWSVGGALRGCVSSAPTTLDARDQLDGDDNGFELAGVGIIGGPVELDGDHMVDHSLDFGCHRPVFDVTLDIVAPEHIDLLPGDLLELQIDVGNDGTLNAGSLALLAVLGDGFALADPDWEQLKDGTLLRDVAIDVLRPGITASLSLQVEILAEGSPELRIDLGSVRSRATMPNGDGFEPESPEDEAQATFVLGSDSDPTGDDAGEAQEPVADGDGAVDPTEPDSSVEGATLEPDPPAPEADDADAVPPGDVEPSEPDVPRQAVAPADLVQPAQDGATPVLALTGAEDRVLVLAALLCIVSGAVLLLLEQWMRPVTASQK